MPAVGTFFRHCPSCGRRFEIRLVSKKEVDSESHFEKKDTVKIVGFSSLKGGGGGGLPVPLVLDNKSETMVDVEEFQYTYKCKHCGHEWTELRDRTRDADAPRGYTGD